MYRGGRCIAEAAREAAVVLRGAVDVCTVDSCSACAYCASSCDYCDGSCEYVDSKARSVFSTSARPLDRAAAFPSSDFFPRQHFSYTASVSQKGKKTQQNK